MRVDDMNANKTIKLSSYRWPLCSIKWHDLALSKNSQCSMHPYFVNTTQWYFIPYSSQRYWTTHALNYTGGTSIWVSIQQTNIPKNNMQDKIVYNSLPVCQYPTWPFLPYKGRRYFSSFVWWNTFMLWCSQRPAFCWDTINVVWEILLL